MNREIKFRSWLARDNKMLQPFTLEDLASEENALNCLYCEGMELPVMQFTGLSDKNGKEIYEGDIVRINKETANTFNVNDTGVVEYRCGAFCFGDDTCQVLHYFVMANDINTLRGEVIGNIYENPELVS